MAAQSQAAALATLTEKRAMKKDEEESYDTAKDFGVFIDSHLNLNSHVKSVENKVAKSVGILSKWQRLLPSTALLKLYYALIHPSLWYGLFIWASTHKSYLSEIQTLQNKDHWRRQIYGPFYTILL